MTAIQSRTLLLLLLMLEYNAGFIMRIEFPTSWTVLFWVRNPVAYPGLTAPPEYSRFPSRRLSLQLLWGRGPDYTARAWAEDRATRGRDPSADPGAKTGVGGRMPPLRIPGLAAKR